MAIRFISAGAGSGKTHRLAELLSERLAAGRARPGAVVATTFTRRAAAELVERVRQRLIRDGHHGHADAIGQALIGTVNSVCGQLLARYAFEMGLSPRLEVLAEREQSALFAQALDRAMSPQDIDEMNRLAARLGLEDWQQEVQRVVDLARANDIPGDALATHARASVAELLAFFPAAVAGDLDADLATTVSRALREIRANGDGTKGTEEYLALLAEAEHRLGRDRLRWSDWVRLSNAQPTKRSQASAGPVQEAALRYERHPRLHADLREWTGRLFELAARALATYQSFKAERGLVDFVDQEHQTLGALGRPEVAAALAQELDLLLVDEFQDTSPIQLALFLKLAGLARECIWVGDVKQAIYGFRGTDPELMKAAIDGLAGAGGSTEVLPFSWRARPALVELTNALFVPAFADYLPAGQVRLDPRRHEVLADPPLRFWEVQGSNAGQRAAALAAGVAGLIGGGVQVLDRETGRPRALRPGDIALLARTNEGAARYAAALAAAGLAVSLERPGLLATPEVHLALACLRRLADPADTLASAEIIALKATGAPEEWLQDRLEYLAAGHPSRAWGVDGGRREPALGALEVLRERLAFLSPAEVVDEALATADVYRDARAWGPTRARSEQRLANLETLRGLAAEYQDHCAARRVGATLGGLLLWLYELAEAKLDRRGGESQGESVQVLTHHGAKGLEWPVVIAADLESPLRGGLWGLSVLPAGAGLDLAAPLASRRLRYWPWPFAGLRSNIPVAQRVEAGAEWAADRQRQTREAVRLLYVSLTRARDLLVLPLQAKAKTRPWLDSLGADWLVPAAGELRLPDGQGIACRSQALEPPAEPPPVAPEPAQAWFPPPRAPSPRPPASLSASTRPLVEGASVGRIVELGPRLALRGPVDAEALGDALHGILAAELIAPGHPDRFAMAAGVLQRHGLAAVLDAEAALACADRLHGVLQAEFRPGRVLVEWPVATVLEGGQRLTGWVDLLLGCPGGWVLIDHKSFPGPSEQWPDRALGYSGQLAAYRSAVEAGTGTPVLSQWIHFCVGGGLVQVVLPRR